MCTKKIEERIIIKFFQDNSTEARGEVNELKKY